MLKIVIMLCSFTSVGVFAQEKFSAEFIAGDYLLVGKGVDTEETYSGNVSIYFDNGLKVKRIINGNTVVGVATFEPVLNGSSKALRIRFSEQKVDYEETCLWASDLDNYARISCYLYSPNKQTDNPGLEVLFIDHGK